MQVFRFAARLVLCASPWFALAPAHAQPAQAVVVTGNVMPRTLGSEFAAASVIGRTELERAGVRDLVAALELLGSAHVEQQGGPGTAAFVRLRGADSRDTLVLIDGVPLNDVTLGLASLAQIPTASIERIEVVRGNLSALYGANATGGVIQIFTRRGGKRSAQASVGVGSRGLRTVDASAGLGSGAFSARVTAGAERGDGFSAIDPATLPNANPDRDGHRRRHASVATDLELATGHALGFDARALHGVADYDDGASFSAPADTHRQTLRQRGATLRGRHGIADGWTLNWRAADGREHRRESSVGAFGPFDFDNVVRNRGAAVGADGALAAGWTLQLGAERLTQATDSADYLVDRRRTVVLRAGVVHDAAWGGVQAAARRDRTSDFGTAETGLLGATWRFADGWSAIATLANSFTPPTLDMLFYAACCSNPALRPERSRNADVALQWQRGATLVRATAFAARQRDKIVSDDDFVPHNVARAKNRGVELAAQSALGAWRLAGEATLHDPVSADDGQRLPRRTREQAALRADYDGGGWGAGARLRLVGDRLDRGQRLPSYAVVDLSARWSVTPLWALRATLDNALDRRYQPTFGYNGKPRAAFVAIEGTLR